MKVAFPGEGVFVRMPPSKSAQPLPKVWPLYSYRAFFQEVLWQNHLLNFGDQRGVHDFFSCIPPLMAQIYNVILPHVVF